jgi:hypothetical protein
MAKFSYSFNQENYHGDFETREEAIAEAEAEAVHGGATRFWTGEQVKPWQPEDIWEAYDWLEDVSCQDEYSIDAAEGWDESTKEQREELEAEVRKVMAAWLDRHDLRPKFWLIENVQEHQLGIAVK